MQHYLINISIAGRKDVAYLIKDGEALKFKYHEIDIEYVDPFPFRALKNIRLQLEKQNILLLINGSRIDVFPGGMALYTEYAYILQSGKTPDKEHKVNIFGNSDLPELIGTVEAQEDYHMSWAEELKKM